MEAKLAGKVTSFNGRDAETRPGANDPQARLVDQELDHLRAEVVYPGAGLFISVAPDAEYRRECFRVHNDWLSEFCTTAPDRLLGVGLLPMKRPSGSPGRGCARSASPPGSRGDLIGTPATIRCGPRCRT